MNVKILVLNFGSSTLKYKVIDIGSGESLIRGIVERIGEGSDDGPADHAGALSETLAKLDQHGLGLGGNGITAIGHRIVHGGQCFSAPTLVTPQSLEQLGLLDRLAPLHNPSARQGVQACMTLAPHIPQVMVFDTAFFQTLPSAAYHYAIPSWLYEKHGIRRYGAHGTSHEFVAQQAAKFLGRSLKDCNLISFHLGNGASVAAIAGGIAVDTSMGLTPLEGLVMGTRSGDIDPSIPLYMASELGMTPTEIDRTLNRESGLRGMCGDSDLREVFRRRDAGEPAAILATDVFVHRIRKYLGAYMAVLPRVDAVTFTAGIGQNSWQIRQAATEALEHLGIELDRSSNHDCRGLPADVATARSRVRILVIATDEELAIASLTAQTLRERQILLQ